MRFILFVLNKTQRISRKERKMEMLMPDIRNCHLRPHQKIDRAGRKAENWFCIVTFNQKEIIYCAE